MVMAITRNNVLSMAESLPCSQPNSLATSTLKDKGPEHMQAISNNSCTYRNKFSKWNFLAQIEIKRSEMFASMLPDI